MPILKYKCAGCGKEFAKIFFNPEDAPRHCPVCGDGNIEEVIPALIDCGIDILNPIQSACLDPAKVKERYGDRLTFHGTISVQDTIPNGTVQDVRDEVILRMRTVGRDGGFIVSPENSIPYDAPLENILVVYDTVRELGALD